MKKFGALITQLYSVNCVSFLPIEVFAMQPGLDLLLNCISEISFRVEQTSSVFQGVQEADDIVTVVDEKPKVG